MPLDRPVLEFYYDVVCPYAYLASEAVEDLAARTGAEVAWKPVLLGGILRAVGAPDEPASAWAEARARMGELDLERQAALRGVPLVRNPRHPVRSLQAMRLIVACPEELRPLLSHALFEAIHVHERDVSDPVVLASIAERFGLDLADTADIRVKEELRLRTDEAVARGMFGVPAVWLRTPEHPLGRMWWGADRLHLVEAALRGVARRDDAPADMARDGAVPWRAGGRPIRARLELFHDFSSPFSYLGATQARRLADEHGAELVLRPMLLGALFNTIGTPNVPIAVMHAARARYQLQDLHDWASWWDVPFAWPPAFPVRTVTPLRAALVEPAITPVVYDALWARGLDIGDGAVLARVLDGAGFDGAALIAATQRADVKDALRANTEEAVALGACGAPTWRVRGEGLAGNPLPEVLIWGQDRLDLVAACLDGWRPPPG